MGPCPIPAHTLAPATQPGRAAPQAVEGQLVTAISFVKTLASNHQQELNLLRCKVRAPGPPAARAWRRTPGAAPGVAVPVPSRGG
jgi:hypothetical protein